MSFTCSQGASACVAVLFCKLHCSEIQCRLVEWRVKGPCQGRGEHAGGGGGGGGGGKRPGSCTAQGNCKSKLPEMGFFMLKELTKTAICIAATFLQWKSQFLLQWLSLTNMSNIHHIIWMSVLFGKYTLLSMDLLHFPIDGFPEFSTTTVGLVRWNRDLGTGWNTFEAHTRHT